jgi:hypothetical protein
MKRDALETLGTIITSDEVRDAVHVACLPAESAERLYPGMRVGYKDGKASPMYTPYLGIVDPFLDGVLTEGNFFWLMLFPRTITGLRHLWSHPDLPDHGDVVTDPSEGKSESELYLRNVALHVGIGFHELVIGAENWAYHSSVPYTNGYEPDHRNVPDVDLFWAAWSEYTGNDVPSDKEIYWSCSC